MNEFEPEIDKAMRDLARITVALDDTAWREWKPRND